MPRVVVTLSETAMHALADEASRLGLRAEVVAERALMEHPRSRAREQEWRSHLGAALDALYASLPPLDPAEVEAEIMAARAEVRAAPTAA
jgi:hypothetical protein